MSDSTHVPAVYAALNKVQLALAKDGIAKSRQNTTQHYSFRGVDDMYNVVGPLLAEHGLIIVPMYKLRRCEERISKQGGALFYVSLIGEYDVICLADGSRLPDRPRLFGEAMDSGDKATNKAMSAAYKYLMMQLFAIPTEGDNDADSNTHEVQAGASRPQHQAAQNGAQRNGSNGAAGNSNGPACGTLTAGEGVKLRLTRGALKVDAKQQPYYTFLAQQWGGGEGRVIIRDLEKLKTIADSDQPEKHTSIELTADIDIKNGWATLLNMEFQNPQDDVQLGPPLDMADAPTGFRN